MIESLIKSYSEVKNMIAQIGGVIQRLKDMITQKKKLLEVGNMIPKKIRLFRGQQRQDIIKLGAIQR